ncbi:carcinoembryonic antigen-related cell adhesion molecule 5-like [Ruditapes philippinarum]|uniref:carcinoembryonic antigen-related cell adhesion molecule 5-like n=1 Tax=Ruditapes philippinarum TaxID=129788 RepID=UPI00295B3E4B|nr:carcinoembryonic antigen-related cell adhesion molecule 5-like [Ruditapes philippinarum]
MAEKRFNRSLLVIQLMRACYCFVNGSVTLSPSPAVADQGESFTFTCTYNGNNTVVGFMWLLNGNTLAIVMIPACTTFNPPGPPDATRYEYACPSSRHSSFTIKHYVNRTNGDTWQCAVAAPGYIFSNNVTIIERVDVTSISLQSPYGPIIENFATNLTCETSTGQPAANITWYKKSRSGKILVLTNNVSFTTVVVGQLEKSTSAISYIPLRTDNGSHIYCNAVNNPRSSPLQSDSFELNILYSPDGPPVIQGFTNGSTYKVIENNQGSLSCYIGESNPEATLMWNCFDNGSLTTTSEANTTKTVTWNATRGLDSYCACQSSHPLAENQTVYITVQVLYLPKIKDCKLRYNASSTSVAVNSTIDIKENSSFTLTCEVDGKPAATTSWSGRVSSTSNILVVDEIKRQQSGTYTIFATNRMEPTFGGPTTGNDTKSFNFNLLYAPTVRMTDKDIVEGANLTLPCPVTKGNPTDTRFKWIRDGDNRTWDTQTLYIQNVTKYDDMMYKCTVQNILRPSGSVEELGINSGSFHLNVLCKLFTLCILRKIFGLVSYNSGDEQISK